MRRRRIAQASLLVVIAILLVPLVVLPASAQEADPVAMHLIDSGIQTAEMGPALAAQLELSAQPPVLSEEQQAQLEERMMKANLPGPALNVDGAAPVAGPVEGTEVKEIQRTKSGEPLAPGDVGVWKFSAFGGIIPSSYNSNIMEPSVGQMSKRAFYTGNWFDAYTLNSGTSWTYVNPYADMPDFCCDQVAQFDSARSIFLWERMGVPDGNGVNRFRLTITRENPTYSWWYYDFYPTNVNGAWTNQMWDYPHMQLSANNLYLSWNMFDAAGNFVRTVMLILPLDPLAAGAGFSYSYVTTTSWFTWVPVTGAPHQMYWASNWPNSAPQNNRISILRYDEITGGLAGWEKTVASAWNLTGRGYAHCGTPNWAARYDMRLLAGTRYVQSKAGFNEAYSPGREVIAFWWNTAEGGGFTYPLIEGAAFYEDTMVQLPGYIGRPYVYGGWCFAYPSVSTNARGDYAMVFNYASSSAGFQRPGVAIALADDYVGYWPPGYAPYQLAESTAGAADQAWGDYTTVRTAQPDKLTWTGAAHIIYPSTTNCSRCSVPLYFAFGRERDFWSFAMWQ